MSIWFYISLVLLLIVILFILKMISLKREIKNILESLEFIIKTDTNNLIMVNSNDKTLKKLASSLNKSLKNLRKLELEYKRGSSEINRAITNISHDIRTPLTAIRGYLDLLNEERLTEKEKNYLAIIGERVNALTHLTEELFLYSCGLDLKESLKKEVVCLNLILENVLASYYVLFKNANIVPKINITKTKIYRSVDKNMFERVLENIISNLVKYAQDKVYIELNNKGELIFQNKTTNLDKVSFEKIFSRYFTVLNAKKSTGLGLFIAKQLIELNGGTITSFYENKMLTIKIMLP